MKKKLIRNIILVIFISIVMYSLIATRPKNITIEVDGITIKHKSTCSNIREVIDELNINLNEEDKINYNLDDKVKNNQNIIINRIYRKEEEIIEKIEFNEIVVKDYKIAIGESKVISEGVQGEKWRITEWK